jgi:hypothetical protein
MSRRARRIATAAVTLVLVCAAAASAYYTAQGGGGGHASVGTLSTPTITTATPGAGTVALTWSAVSAPASGPVTYYVRRDGGAASAACPSLAAPTAVTSCTDTGVSTAAHSYTVTARWRTWSGTSASTNVSVTYGPVASLVVTTQPASSTGGIAFPTQPVVTAKDASNVTVANYAGTVALSIKSGTGTSGAVLSGCSGALSNGVTTFSGCAIDKSGANYKLTASDGTRSVDTANLTITVGALAQLAFTQQPAGATGGAAFATQPKVTAQDAGGNTITSYNGTVTLTLKSGTGTAGATLSNCSGNRSNGVVTFSACELDKVGSAYQLHAGDGTRTADSAAFDVTAGAMASLVFTTSPSNATGGSAFPTQPVVTALDAGGNVATGYAGTVALTIRTPGTNGTLSGCSQSRSSGVVTFSGCKIAEIGTGYRLRAKDGSPQVDSSTFNVTLGPLAAFSLSTDATPTAGAGTDVVVTATDAGGNTVTSYTGSHSLTFGGASAGPTSGALPTVVNSSGSAIAFGSATALTFASGVSSVSGTAGTLTLHKAETTSLTVTDGTLTNGAGFAVTVAPGTEAKLAWTSPIVSAGTLSSPCLFTCTATGIGDAHTFKATVSAIDVDGNIAQDVGGNTGSRTVSLTRTGTGSFSPGGSSTTVTLPSSGAATSGQFTYTTPAAAPSWTSNTLTAALGGLTSATATLNR